MVVTTVVLPGKAQGVIMRHDAPLSFWGGVDPKTAVITDTGSPRCGESLAGRILLLRATRGSSSSSSVLLELIANGMHPAALVIGAVDAILGVAILVAREMGYKTPPLLTLSPECQERVHDGQHAVIRTTGELELR